MAAVTITTTAPQDVRLGPAFGDRLKLGRPATATEVKNWLIDQMRAVVADYENRQAVAALVPTAFDPT